MFKSFYNHSFTETRRKGNIYTEHMKPKTEDGRFALLKGQVSEATGQNEVDTRWYTQEVDTLSLLHHFAVRVSTDCLCYTDEVY